MPKTINIGTDINLEDLIQSRMLIQANSGGGKSVTARVLMEEAYGHVPFITFDRDGEYYTLKEHFPDVIVIGGSFPDLKLSLSAAGSLPAKIVEAQLSVVFDLSDLKSGEKQSFVKDFLEALMDLPQSLWKPYLIFIEEAHFFCGQQDKNPAGAAVRELMSGGRKKGFCGILITQRISKLHKDAAAEVNNKFVGRTNLDVDMDRAAQELGFSKAADRLQLRDLKPGHFFAYGTSIEPHHVHLVKIKLPRTKQPKAGVLTEIKTGKPTEKVLAALQKLGDAPKTELKKVPSDGGFSEFNAVVQKFEEYKAETDRQIAGQLRTIEEQHKLIEHYAVKMKALRDIVLPKEPVVEVPALPYSFGKTTKTEQPQPAPQPILSTRADLVKAPKPEYNKPQGIITTSAEKLGKCAQAILEFLASYPNRWWSKAQAGIATGYSPSSGGFNNALSELNSKELISRQDGKLRIRTEATPYLPKGFTPQRYSIHTFKNKLAKCEREIYEALLEQPNRLFSKPDLASYTPTNYSPTSGGFNNALSTLSTLELIERRNGEVRLNPELLELQ